MSFYLSDILVPIENFWDSRSSRYFFSTDILHVCAKPYLIQVWVTLDWYSSNFSYLKTGICPAHQSTEWGSLAMAGGQVVLTCTLWMGRVSWPCFLTVPLPPPITLGYLNYIPYIPKYSAFWDRPEPFKKCCLVSTSIYLLCDNPQSWESTLIFFKSWNSTARTPIPTVKLMVLLPLYFLKDL